MQTHRSVQEVWRSWMAAGRGVRRTAWLRPRGGSPPCCSAELSWQLHPVQRRAGHASCRATLTESAEEEEGSPLFQPTLG